MTRRRTNLRLVLLSVAPNAAWAHAFGVTYALPIPFWMYVYGCAATLVITFCMTAFSAHRSTKRACADELYLGVCARGAALWGLRLLATGSLGCLFLTIGIGLITHSRGDNALTLILFWVIFLLAFGYATALFGDLYALINPWKLLIVGLERVGLNFSKARVHYPSRLACWPAFAAYAALIWVELFLGPTPFMLSILLLVYSGLTFTGAALFGKDSWFSQADFFSLFFRLLGALAPIKYNWHPTNSRWQIRLQPPFTEILTTPPRDISIVAFVFFMLASTTYDGIHDTVWWAELFWASSLRLVQPIWGDDLRASVQDWLLSLYLAYRQLGLLLFPFLYMGLYVLLLQWTQALTKTSISLRTLVLNFCYPLIPVALAYNFAHNYTFLITGSRSLLGSAAEIFHSHWNEAGRAGMPGELPVSMSFVWHTELAALLAGHMASVCLTHGVAVRLFPSKRTALISELPLLLLTIIYTTIGLWTLSLPVAK